ncbi:MAG: YajQ family cyclic di-GMP-binding protein [Deltaproteobacteria bacterium]|nr:YajQ family cyclic di-GMP-binding protein [Deltaproteobacteria bacterium]
MPSFDVVSEVDMQEVDNAVNQAKKELENRYDFRNSKSSIELDKTSGITIAADDDMKLKAIKEILNQKATKRGISVRSLDYQEPEKASSGSVRQLVKIRRGISQDDARKIVKLIKDEKLKKVQAQIQQEQVRVIGPKKDDLQEVIALLREKIDSLDLQFVNFKD